jgi:hypothetical protein
LGWYEFRKMIVCADFNNQNGINKAAFISKCCTFALETFQSVTQREGLISINKVKRERYEKD